MSMKEELEFISVAQDEDDGAMTSTYHPAGTDSADDQQLGSWIFKQSKVVSIIIQILDINLSFS